MSAGAPDAALHRIKLMVGRGVIAGVDDATKMQNVQVDVLADETHDGVERFQSYGLTSVPHPGAETVVVFAGGLRSHGLAIVVDDRRYRLTGLQGGEVALHDDLGQVVHLTRDGIRIATSKDVTVEAVNVKILADHLDLGGEGGAGVARIGDTVADGVITGGSEKVFAA